jgi:hypothetical protein
MVGSSAKKLRSSKGVEKGRKASGVVDESQVPSVTN